MTRRVFMICAILLAVLIQQLLPGWPAFGGIKPPVLAALVAYCAMHRDPQELWPCIVLCALLYDGLEMGVFGPALLTFPVIGLVIHHVRNEVFSDGIMTQAIFGLLSSLLLTLASLFIYAITGLRSLAPGPIFLLLFGSMFLGLFTLPLLALVLTRLEAMLPKRKGYGWQ